MKSWRDRAMPLVAEALETGRSIGLAGRDLVRYANAQFPWGPREMHPYQVWRSEVKRQMGLVRMGVPSRPADLPGQGMMF